MDTVNDAFTPRNKAKTSFRSLPLEIQQQVCCSAITLSQQRLEETFIHDKITYFNPVRIYNRLETCIIPNLLISAERYMNIRKACSGIEPVPRGFFGNKYMLYMKPSVLDVNQVIWFMRKLDISRIGLDLRGQSHDVSSAEDFIHCLLIRAAYDRIYLAELLVILPNFNEYFLEHDGRSIPRLVHYGNTIPVMLWVLDPWMKQFWIKPTSWVDTTDATAATFSAREGLRESKLCRCRKGEWRSESTDKFEGLCWHSKLCSLLKQVMKGDHFW